MSEGAAVAVSVHRDDSSWKKFKNEPILKYL